MKTAEETLKNIDPLIELSTLNDGKSVIITLDEIYSAMDKHAQQFRSSQKLIAYIERHIKNVIDNQQYWLKYPVDEEHKDKTLSKIELLESFLTELNSLNDGK